MRAREILTGRPSGGLVDGAVLGLRLAVGIVFLAHGLDTLGMGMSGIVEMQRATGIPLPEVAGPFTVLIEVVGGPLLMVGALTRVVALGLSVVMLGAFGFVHAANGIFVENGGFELVLVLGIVSVFLLAYGPGRYSADKLIAARLPRTAAPEGERV